MTGVFGLASMTRCAHAMLASVASHSIPSTMYSRSPAVMSW